MARFNERGRVLIVALGLSACFLAVFARSLYLMVGENSDRATLLIMARDPQSLRQLTLHAEELRRLTADIESVSLGEIRAATRRTVTLVERANIEIAAQVAAWEKTRGLMRQDENAYTTLRSEISDMQRFRDEEIIRFQRTLQGIYSIRDKVVEVALTMLIGVVASMLAAALFPAKSIRALRRVLRARQRRVTS